MAEEQGSLQHTVLFVLKIEKKNIYAVIEKQSKLQFVVVLDCRFLIMF